MAKPLFNLDVVTFSKYPTKPQVPGKFPEATCSPACLPAQSNLAGSNDAPLCRTGTGGYCRMQGETTERAADPAGLSFC